MLTLLKFNIFYPSQTCSLLSNSGGQGRLCQVLDEYLVFVRNNSEKLYYSGQDTDKTAREALLLLETQRKDHQHD